METPPAIRLRGPLQEDTKKQRRNLIAVSAIGIAFFDVGLVPQKISAFGIESSQIDQKALSILLFFTILYFLIEFLIYAFPDLLSWRAAISWSQSQLAKDIADCARNHSNDPINYWEAAWGKRTRRVWSVVLSDLKAIFDLALPVSIATYASIGLLGYELLFDLRIIIAILLLSIIIYLTIRYIRVNKEFRQGDEEAASPQKGQKA